MPPDRIRIPTTTHVGLPLPYLLQILKRLILSLHDGGHPAQGGLLQLLAPVETVPELEQTHVVLRHVIDQVAGRVDLSQRQLVVILAKEIGFKISVHVCYYINLCTLLLKTN
jgi:hypothetical protein